MLAWHLGARYLRKRRTAWLAIGAIILTVAVPVIVMGVMQGMVEATRRQVRANEADITIEAPFRVRGIDDSTQRRARLAAVRGVAGVAPFVSTQALLVPRYAPGAPPADPLGALVDGIDWRADAAIGRLAHPLLHPKPGLELDSGPLPPQVRGSGFLTPDWRDDLALIAARALPGVLPLPLPPHEPLRCGAVVGRELAYINGLSTGMPIELMAPTASGGSAGKIFAEISDTVGTGILEVDRYAVLVPLPLGERLIGRRSEVSGYRIQATEGSDLDTLRKRIAADTDVDIRITTWWERRSYFVKSLLQMRNIMVLVMVCIQIIAVFIVYAVFSTLVAEKRHDLGVLLGIGATRGSIAGAFLIASLAACLGGGLVGWALGWGVLPCLDPVSRYFNLPLFPQDVFYVAGTPVSWDPLWPLLFLGVMTTVGLVAAVLPAWRAARIDPVEILRESG